MGLQEIECEDMGWIDLHQDRVQVVANVCDDGNEPFVFVKWWETFGVLECLLLLIASEDSVE